MRELTDIEKLLLATRGLKEGSIVADKEGQPFRVSYIDKERCVIVSYDGRELKSNEIRSLTFSGENLVKIGFEKIRNTYQFSWYDANEDSHKMVISRTVTKHPYEKKGWRIRIYNYRVICCDLRIEGMDTLMNVVQNGWKRLFYDTPLGLSSVWW